MDTFNKTSLQNILNIFEQRTGVKPEIRTSHRYFVRIAAAAAFLVCSLSITAFSFGLFSSLSGDDLGLSADYEGNGIVSIRIENRSDRELNFQSQLKLMRWSTGEEVLPVSDEIVFSGTEIKAHTKGTMTLDLSKAYDMDVLEQPLIDDHYYFVLTNNHFAFGQDWMCSVEFAEPVITAKTDPSPITPQEADPDIVSEITEELRPYFETYTLDTAERNRLAGEYLALCQELLAKLEGKLVTSVSPMELTLADSHEQVVFDPSVPVDMQLQLTGLHRRSLDGYDKVIGSSDGECAMVLSAYIPQKKGDIDGGVDIPLIYVFIYEADAVQSLQDYAFIRGRLMTFEQMEAYKIYEDEQYVCYNASNLFYSDLRQYVESMVSQRSDVYFDEQVWERVQNIYTYYNEKIGSLLCYRNSDGITRISDQPASGEEFPGIPEAVPIQPEQTSAVQADRQDTAVQTADIEKCYDDPKNPVSAQNYGVGEPKQEN